MKLNSLARYPVQIVVGGVCAALLVVSLLGGQFAVRGLRISVQDATEAANRTLTRVFVNENWDSVKPLLPPAGSGAQAAKSNPNIAAIDQIVRRFSSYTDVLKVKIYDRNGITVYSSDRAQIGEDKSRNGGFQAAARGEVASELTYRGSFGAFDGEMYDRNLVSTYVPVRVGSNIEAVLEIYADRTESIQFLNRELRNLALQMLPWIVLVLLVVGSGGVWLHRARLSIEREDALAQDEIRRSRLEAATAAAKAQSTNLMGQLPDVFDRLDCLLDDLRQSARRGEVISPKEGGVANADSLGDLVADLELISHWASLRRDLMDVQENRFAPGTDDFNVEEVLEEALSSVRPGANARGREILSHSLPSSLGSVHADRALFVKILTLLIAASLDLPVSPSSPGRIQCKFVRESGNLRVDIIDDTVGMLQEQLDQWLRGWELERRLPAADREGLVGWRLVLARSLASRIGGRLDARSTPGHGNRWSLDLPFPVSDPK